MVISKKMCIFALENRNSITIRTDGQRDIKATEKMTIHVIIAIYSFPGADNDIKENLFAFESQEEAKEAALNLKTADKVNNVKYIKDYEIEEIELY